MAKPKTYGPYPATITGWHDGDTATMDLDLGFGLILALSCRVYGINTPELNTPAGPPARDHATNLAPPGTVVTVLSHGWDKYGGRFLGQITLPDGTPYAQTMINAGHAKPYHGKGPKPT